MAMRIALRLWLYVSHILHRMHCIVFSALCHILTRRCAHSHQPTCSQKKITMMNTHKTVVASWRNAWTRWQKKHVWLIDGLLLNNRIEYTSVNTLFIHVYFGFGLVWFSESFLGIVHGYVDWTQLFAFILILFSIFISYWKPLILPNRSIESQKQKIVYIFCLAFRCCCNGLRKICIIQSTKALNHKTSHWIHLYSKIW